MNSSTEQEKIAVLDRAIHTTVDEMLGRAVAPAIDFSRPEALAKSWQVKLPSTANHPQQDRFVRSKAKRKIIRAGRRGGKTIGSSIIAAQEFLRGGRVVYTTPTQEQIDAFWTATCEYFDKAIRAGIILKNETYHTLKVPGTTARIKAKTAWNADTLRGGWATLLIFDEWQLMNEDAWERAGAPMLLDKNGNAIFIYTPPSNRTAGVSKAKDLRHAAKMFKLAEAEMKAAQLEGRESHWETFHFTSRDNPFNSVEGMANLLKDMTIAAQRAEIEAIDDEETPGALWTRELLDATRIPAEQRALILEKLVRITVSVDPATTSNPTSNETGITVQGRDENKEAYVLEDASVLGTPYEWSKKVIQKYLEYEADCIVYETNQGGELVEYTLQATAEKMKVKIHTKGVRASRGKIPRAEPIVALYEHNRVHHVGYLLELEDQQCNWTVDNKSPDRLDAVVWGLDELIPEASGPGGAVIKSQLWGTPRVRGQEVRGTRGYAR